MTCFVSVFQIVLGGNGEGDDGERKENRRLDFFVCVLKKNERKEYMYLVLTVLSSP